MIYSSEDVKRTKIDPETLAQKADRFFVLFRHVYAQRKKHLLGGMDSQVLFIPLEEMDTREIKKKLESMGYDSPVIVDLKRI